MVVHVRTETRLRRADLDGGRGSWRRVAADLAAVLTGPLLVVELQLFGGETVVVAHGLRLLRRGLVQQLR